MFYWILILVFICGFIGGYYLRKEDDRVNKQDLQMKEEEIDRLNEENQRIRMSNNNN